MSFLWPVMLVSLALIPIFVGLYLRLQRRRGHLAARFGGFGLAQTAGGQGLGLRRHLPPALFLLGLTGLLLSLARPQTAVSLPRLEGTIILAFDVSGSMAAEDLQPARMEAAKTVAREFTERQPDGIQIGVVSFSDSGFAVQTPTDDHDAILAAIARLRPERGTSLGRGLQSAMNVILAQEVEDNPRLYSNLTPLPTAEPTPVPPGTYSPAVIILLSDGENNIAPDPLAVAQAAADRGVRIYTVGIGSAAGAIIEVEGFTVHTQLNEALLQQIAQLTGGAYYRAENEAELRAIYEAINPQWVVRPETMEVTALFAGASLTILLLSGALSLLWLNRLP